jgi:flagellar basal body rod protein FlgF
VETSGTDSVEVEVSSRQVTLQETCSRDKVVVTATAAPGMSGIPDWNIRVPRSASLDLSTQAGSIRVQDTDGAEVYLRTSGGKVTAGNIKGNALIKGGEVRTGNIGGNVELRGMGGRLQIGDVGGTAEFNTAGGDITTGAIRGSVKAVSGSGSITIRESNGDVVVTTREGDITSEYIHGGFDGRIQEGGNIRVERTGSWVHAFTKVGDIVFKLVPEKLGGDLHINAETGIGNITMFLPEKMKATIDAVIDKPAIGAKKFFSDFPMSALKAPANAVKSLPLIPGGPEKQGMVINGGGNNIKARTSSGTISIWALKGN